MAQESKPQNAVMASMYWLVGVLGISASISWAFNFLVSPMFESMFAMRILGIIGMVLIAILCFGFYVMQRANLEDAY